MVQNLADYIPLSKSWMNRMGFLDLFKGYDDTLRFLECRYDELGGDLQALYRASVQWKTGGPVDVGESGTLLRFLRFASWKLGQERMFILRETLAERPITKDQSIVDWPLEKLLTLDNGTTQWASSSILTEYVISGMFQRKPIQEPEIQMTYDAIEHWDNARKQGTRWEPRYDETLLAQASAYLQWLREGKMEFTPQKAEDYCFARAFEIMTPEEGASRWQKLRGHESNRIPEMEQELQKVKITSKDHRVVQAIAMLKGKNVTFVHPDSVNKSWPQFFKFLDYASSL